VGTGPAREHWDREDGLVDDEDDEDDEALQELAELPGHIDDDTPNVMVSASHRQSWDDPAVTGPFKDGRAARTWVLQQYRTGNFDPDGCSVSYARSTQP